MGFRAKGNKKAHQVSPAPALLNLTISMILSRIYVGLKGRQQ
jgi:hypothetical protein